MKLNISGKITEYFINSQLTVLLMAATAILGIFALWFTPREENPQITVPAANVMVQFPGSSAKEVEELVSKRLEAKLWEIPGSGGCLLGLDELPGGCDGQVPRGPGQGTFLREAL